jgi:metal-dependent HD superfamily phosphatase/phosphodiesterase
MTETNDVDNPVTYESMTSDPEVREMIAAADEQMEAIGYTEHGMRHATIIAENAGTILEQLERTGEDRGPPPRHRESDLSEGPCHDKRVAGL